VIGKYDRVAALNMLRIIAQGVVSKPDNELWMPNPGPQTDAFNCEADELFYGGAAGGGKSDLILGLGIKAHKRSVIFRREYPQLKALMARCEEVVGRRGRLNHSTGMMLLMDGGRIEFGSCPHESNRLRWQGRPHDLKAFDEICHFTRPIYMFLKSWVRSEVSGQRKRVVCTGNPPTDSDGEWVIDYWGPWLKDDHPNPAKPGELRWYVTTKDGETDVEVEGPDPVTVDGEELYPRSRTFIPALLSDNPYLCADNDYLSVIQSLAEPLRSQLLTGNFGIRAEDNQWQIVPTEWYDAATARWDVKQGWTKEMTALGVDVARGGADNTTLAPFYGTGWIDHLLVTPGKQTPDGDSVVQLVVRATLEHNPIIGIDVIGVGASPYDIMNSNDAINVHGINFGAGSTMTDRSGKYKMGNLRAAAYWGFREALDPEFGDLAVPPDADLKKEVCMVRWKVRAGKIWVESKEDVIARLGRSPDLADAAVLAHFAHKHYGGNVAW